MPEATGPCEDREAWQSDDPSALQPYASCVGTLVNPVRREQLVAHPILKDLEALRFPAMSNPQIVTPEQLDALRNDFDLTVGPLPDDVREALLQDEDVAELWVAGPDGRDIEVFEGETGYSVWRDGAEVGPHRSWREAYSDACSRRDIDSPITHLEEPDPIAAITYTDGVIWIARVGETQFRAYFEPADEPDVLYDFDEDYASLEHAVLTLGEVGD